MNDQTLTARERKVPSVALCDDCVPDELAECKDFCNMPLDHDGECSVHRNGMPGPTECARCGETGRLHRVAVVTVQERDEGQWWADCGSLTQGPYPSAQEAREQHTFDPDEVNP